jgi:hypothetical protein
LNELNPDSENVEIYHVSSSPLEDFEKRGGWESYRSFALSESAANKLINDLGGSGYIYKLKVPKNDIAAVVDYDDPNISDYAYQEEILNEKPISVSQIEKVTKKEISPDQAPLSGARFMPGGYNPRYTRDDGSFDREAWLNDRRRAEAELRRRGLTRRDFVDDEEYERAIRDLLRGTRRG